VRRPRAARLHIDRSAFAGFRFPPEVITVAVRWYLRYGLSYRDVEELLAERGVEVDHVTVYRWVQRFTPLLIDAARPVRHATGDRWFVDETYVKVAGQYANNRMESDHARPKARLRPMRGLKRFLSAGRIAASHAFVQNLRRGDYELASDV
jgi:transposase-like protein